MSRQHTGKSLEDKNVAPEYFVHLKEQFIQKCLEMGLDYTDVSNFLEDKCLPEMNYELIMDFL